MANDLLDEQVAHATGEDARTIRRIGFSRLQRMPLDSLMEEDYRPPQVFDWDDLDLQRGFSVSG